MSIKIVSHSENHSFEINCVTSYKINIETPKTSLAKTYDTQNELIVTLKVAKTQYQNTEIQTLLKWAECNICEEDYYRDFGINIHIMDTFEQSIVFTHAYIVTNICADTEADFVTIKAIVNQKRDKFVGVVFGETLDETYVTAYERVTNPPRPMFVPSFMIENTNVEYTSSGPKGSFQVIDITGTKITLKLDKMRDNFILVYELNGIIYNQEDLLPGKGKQILFKKTDFSYPSHLVEGLCIIEGLKPHTDYNITIMENSTEYKVLNNPIRTFFDSNYIISDEDYESKYKKQFEAMEKNVGVPLSQKNYNEKNVTVRTEYKILDNIIIKKGVKDTPPISNLKELDGINNLVDYRTSLTYFENLKYIYFNYLGFSVYECPFKPNHFNTSPSLAMLGKTQWFVDIEKKEEKVYKTISDLDELNSKHKGFFIVDTTFTTFRIILSLATDVGTVISLGEAQSIRAFLEIFMDGIINPDFKTGANWSISIASDIAKGNFPPDGLSEFGIWLMGMLVPFVGTTQLILDLVEIEPTITKVVNTKFNGYSLDDIKGINGEVKGIFFTADY